MSHAALKRRLDPPQKAAVAVSVATPLVAGVIYVALRTDWLRQVGRWLAWAGGALAAGLAQIAAWPWAGIGYAFLVIAATNAITAFLGWTACERLLDSLDRFGKDHCTGEKTPFGGDDEYALELTTVESRRNEWIRDDLDDLDAYAEYHPSFAKALGEWRTAQAKENE